MKYLNFLNNLGISHVATAFSFEKSILTPKQFIMKPKNLIFDTLNTYFENFTKS